MMLRKLFAPCPCCAAAALPPFLAPHAAISRATSTYLGLDSGSDFFSSRAVGRWHCCPGGGGVTIPGGVKNSEMWR